ncbi:MAG: hypothetical protein Ta2B_02090 [Termitinemataceae bacterium]|nr:MAG: hypothetical protein Ta2B_02090 [Termitinemataceae bacterium]
MPIKKINGEDIAWTKDPETGKFIVYNVKLEKQAVITPEILTEIINYELDPNTPKDPV